MLAFDLAAGALVLLLLRRLRLPLIWFAVYWWNPVLIKEGLNTGHMDLVVLPFLLGAIYLALRDRPVLSAASLALAAGAKVWPVLLLAAFLPVYYLRFWVGDRMSVGIFDNGIVWAEHLPVALIFAWEYARGLWSRDKMNGVPPEAGDVS